MRSWEWEKICRLEDIYLEMSRIREFQKRAKQIGIDVIYLCRELPDTSEFRIIRRQIIRSATSVGANYRAVSRAKSDADFIHKLTIVEEEADETIYWLEIIEEMVKPREIEKVEVLKNELNEILSIAISSIRTVRSKSKK
jgi:four helix bundle protein